MKAGESTPAASSSPSPPIPSRQEQVEAAIVLAAEFDRPETDEARRLEVISELAVSGTPAARQTLTRIYRSARGIEIKKEVLESLHLIESDDLEPSLLLLQEAVASGQNEELRAVAVDALRDVDSPKTLRIWQTLLADRDKEIRDTAKTMIEILAAQVNSR
ncbi:MAG: hypothetical protein QOE70_2714 [Chthoniobacter sp.]|nr:hypothetical protein [Chthoniobacter sp.]